MSFLLSGLSIVQRNIDQFWSGVWWLHYRRWRQERKLAKVLEESGERSMATRPVTEQYRNLERSVRYWRSSPPLVQATLEASERAGIPLSDLQLLSVNREIRQVGETVEVRSHWAILIVAYPMIFMTVSYWAGWSLLAAMSSAPLVGKCVAIAVLTFVYWFLGSGLCMYTTRPYAAAKRSGQAIQQTALALSSGCVRNCIDLRTS